MKATFINLPIHNVKKTDDFFGALGLEKNPHYADDRTTNCKLNDTTFVMLLEDSRFIEFTNAPIDRHAINHLVAMSFDTPQAVDDFFHKAIAAGATDTTKPNPDSDAFMYGKAFRDINGHIWELFAFLQEMPK